METTETTENYELLKQDTEETILKSPAFQTLNHHDKATDLYQETDSLKLLVFL